jgi:hypothetical protein
MDENHTEIEVLNNLERIGVHTSIYDADLLKTITNQDLYVLTLDGKAYAGDSIVYKETKTKHLITKDTVRVVYDEEKQVIQFFAFFKNGVVTDARGLYARTLVKIFKRKRKVGIK